MPERGLIIGNNIQELERLTAFMDESAAEWGISRENLYHLNLVAEEVVSNIILYGYGKEQTDETIQFKLLYENGELKMYVRDQGREFDPMKIPPPDDLGKPVSERKVGGLGIHFTKEIMDRLEYHREGRSNVLILSKKIS